MDHMSVIESAQDCSRGMQQLTKTLPDHAHVAAYLSKTLTYAVSTTLKSFEVFIEPS